MRKWKIALISIIVLFIAALVSPFVFYYFELPTISDIEKAENVNSAFKFWEIEEGFLFSQKDKFPHKEFKCSLCYPHDVDSAECRDRMSSWISRNLNANSHNERMLHTHVKNYLLSKAILNKYDDDTFYRLYLAFISRPLAAKSIEEACLIRFKKDCQSLTFDETIDLEIAARMGATKSTADDLRKNISLFCAK